MNFFEIASSVLARFGVRAEDVEVEIGKNDSDWEPLYWERYRPECHDPHLRGEWRPKVDVIVTATPTADGRERRLVPEHRYEVRSETMMVEETIAGVPQPPRPWRTTYPMAYRGPSCWELRDLIQTAASEAGLGVGIYHLQVR